MNKGGNANKGGNKGGKKAGGASPKQQQGKAAGGAAQQKKQPQQQQQGKPTTPKKDQQAGGAQQKKQPQQQQAKATTPTKKDQQKAAPAKEEKAAAEQQVVKAAPAQTKKGGKANANANANANKNATKNGNANANANAKKGGKKEQAKPAVAEPAAKKAKVEEKKGDDQSADADAKALEPAFEEVKSIQDELEKSIKEEDTKVREIAREYNTSRKPTFAKRGAAIAKVPGFWIGALLNSPIRAYFSENDLEILQHLKEISVHESTTDEKDKNAADYKITFTFDKNAHFQNKTLWKSFTFTDEDCKVVASKISWNKGKNPSAKKPEEDKANKKKRDFDEIAEESFFVSWFVDDDQPDDQISEFIRDELWRDPLKWFQGEGMFDSDDDDDDDDDDLDAMDEDDDEGDD